VWLGVSFSLRTAFVVVFAGFLVAQQEQKPAETKATPPMTTAARLAAAKTAFLRRIAGRTIPFDVISSAVEGWGKFTLVETPEKADIIFEVSSTGDSPVSVSSSVDTSAETGHMQQSTKSTREISSDQITLTVLDAKTRLPLWTATEHPKHAMKKVDRENNEVEAAQHLVTRFHDYIEPAQK
jgi:predicted Zn-dependent protease